MVLGVGLTGVAELITATQSRWAAQTAADLAALAGAQAMIDGASLAEGCVQAELAARANGASLVDCRAAGPDRITVACTYRAAGLGTAKALAVAGPPDQPAGGKITGGVSDALALAVVQWARQQIGKPYIWGGNGPDGYDCSGLVQQAYLHAANRDVPRVAQDQYDSAVKVPYDQMRPGDLIFWVDHTGVHHVAINAGNGLMVEAPSRGKPVREVPIRWGATTAWAGRY